MPIKRNFYLLMLKKIMGKKYTHYFLFLSFFALIQNSTNAQIINAGTDTSFCSGNSIKLGGNPVATGSPISFSWTSSASTTVFSTDPTPTVSPDSTIDYYLMVTYSSGRLYDTVRVSVKNLPSTTHLDLNASLSGSQPYTNCVVGGPYTLTLMNFSTTTSSNSSYTIDWGDSTSTNLTPSNYSYQGTTSHTYTVQGYYYLNYKVTGSNGCRDSIRDTVFHGSNPIIGITNPGNTTDCTPYTLPFQINYRDTSFNPNVPGTKYRITSNYPGFVDSIYYHPKTGMPDSIYVFTFIETSCGYQANTIPNGFYVEVVSTNQCASAYSAAYPIHINDGANAYFTNTPDPKICQGNIMSFNGSDSTGVSINPSSPGKGCEQSLKKFWTIEPMTGVNVTSGTLGLNGFGPLFYGTKNIQVRFDSVGTFKIKYFLANYCGLDSFEKEICVVPIPKSSFELSNSFLCNTDSIQITSSYTSLNFCDSSSFKWSVSGIDNNCSPSSPNWAFIDSTNARSKNPSIKFLSSGLYQITLHDSNYCGVDSFSLVDIVASKPEVYFNIKPDSFCVNSPFTIDSISVSDCYDSTTTYLWTFNGGTIQNPSLLDPGNFSSDSVGTYIISLTVTNRCSDSTYTDTINIVNNPAIISILALSDVCVDANSFQLINATPVGGTYYSPNNSSYIESNVFYPSIAGAGTHKIYYTYTNSSFCTSIDSTTINVDPLPNTNAGNDTTICINDTIRLNPSIEANHTYSWYLASSFLSNQTNLSIHPKTTTQYILKDSNNITGCTNLDTVKVIVELLPPVNAGIDSSICLYDSIKLGSLSAGYSYLWSSNPIGFNSSLAQPTVSPSVSTTYYLSVNSPLKCFNYDTIIVIVDTLPEAMAGNLDTICFNDSIQLGAPSVIGNSYVWSSNPYYMVASVSNPIVAPLSTTTYRLVETITATGCNAEDSVQIVVNSLPNVIAKDTGICYLDTATLLVSPSSLIAYSWSPSIGLSSSTSSVTKAYPSQTTTYFVAATDSNSCIGRDTVVVSIYDLPNTNFSIDSGSCGLLSLITDNHTDSLSLYDHGYKWEVSPSAGVVLDDTLYEPTVFVPLNTTQASIRYRLILTSTSKEGCVDQDTQQTVVYPKPLAKYRFSLPDSCSPDTAFFTNLSDPYNSEGIGTMSFLWDFGSVQQDPKKLYTNTGVVDSLYAVELISTSQHGCKDTFVDTVVIHPDAKSDFNPTSTTGCAPLVLDSSLINLTQYASANDIYSWTIFGSDSSTVLSSFQGVSFNSYTMINDDDTTYVRLITSSSYGCKEDTLVRSFTTTKDPVADFSMSDTTGCGDTQVSLRNASTPGGLSFQWNFGDGDTSIQTNPNHVFGNSSNTQDSSYVVRLIVTAGSGCSDTMVKSFTAFGEPLANFGANEVCEYKNTIFTDSSLSGGSPLSKWNWDFGDTFSDTLQNPNHTYNQDGTYNVKLIVTNGHGCIDSITKPILSYPIPILSFSYDTIVCEKDSILINNTTTGASKYDWTFGNGNSDSRKTPKVYYDSIGFFTIRHIATSDFGCYDSLSKSIQVIGAPQASFIPSIDEGCAPLTVNFTNNSTAEYSEYKWDYGQGDVSLGPIPNTIVYEQGKHDTTYYVKLVVSNQCKIDTFIDSILVHPTPVALFETDRDIGCSPLNLQFSNNLTYGDPDTLIWNFGDGSPIYKTTKNTIDEPLFHSYKTDFLPSDYTIIYIAKNSCGADTAEKLIVVYKTVEASFDSDTLRGCFPLTVNLTNTSKGYDDFAWDFGDGNTSNINNPSHTFTQVGTFTVKLFASDSCSYDTFEQQVIVYPEPIVSFDFIKDSICQFDSIRFISTSNNVSDVYWDFGDGGSSNQKNISHQFNSSGTFNVKYTGYSALHNCPATIAKDVHILPKPEAGFVPSIDSLCEYPTNVDYANTSKGAQDYNWIFGDGSRSTQTNPALTLTSAGTFYDTLIVSDQFGCLDTAVSIIKIFDPPKADARISPLNGCVPLEVYFENLSTNYLSSKWDFGNGDTSNQSDLTYSYDLVGSYLPSLIVYGNANCSDTFKLSTTIDVYPNPIADFDYSIENVLTIFNNKSTGADSYLWDFGNGESSIQENPIYQFPESGIFNTLLVATNNFGCKDSISKSIDISQSYNLFVSNAFSPEFGEPEVRKFQPRGIGLAEYQIYIYDTWGNLLWESDKLSKTEPSEGWDGKDPEGKDMPQDTYVWKVTAKFLNGRIWPGKVYPDGSVKRYGTVTLIR
jgi:PKD repeat protein